MDPRVDNALAITTDGRKLATDAKMLSPTAPDFPESKVNQLVENVFSTWKETADKRGAQMIFADMGVNPTAWGYSPYSEIIEKLVAHGIPRDQIAAIGDAESDPKKQALFEKVRQGSVRVLIGSTQKMGCSPPTFFPLECCTNGCIGVRPSMAYGAAERFPLVTVFVVSRARSKTSAEQSNP